ncbi:hypothetical protein WA026_014862 [Henosepilachna vigintioctopunctata]|uniref:Major facilitator superfamily (MFS) profile domain-containing protein n=1 Tax=Henosepilachna vigintioctopunctata TaxID=420089 RepID=A0AAW1URG6_9CUCU
MNSLIGRSTLSQITAVTVKNIVLLGYGMSLGFPTLLIPDLSRRNVDDPLYLGPEGISWIASINLFAIPFGCLVSGVVTQPLGRRRSMQLINIPFGICWIVYYFSSEAWHILVTLAITGLAGGLKETPVLTYVVEISQPHLRGTLTSTASVTVAAGVMLEFILGKFLNWKSAALCSLVVPFLSFSLLFFIPETPSWLLSKGRSEEAKRSLAWLRGWVSEENVTKEYEKLRHNLRINSELENHNTTINQNDIRMKLLNELSVLKLFRKRNFRRPFMLLTVASFLVHFCGLSPIQVYAVNLFTSLHSPIDGHTATAILGVVGLLGSLLCVTIIGKCGRRVTSFISLSGTAVAFFVLGTYTHFFNINSLMPPKNITKYMLNTTAHSSTEMNVSQTWFPFVTLLMAAFSAQMGIRLLPWTLVAEVFPNEIRDISAGMVAMNFYILGSICNKVFLKYTDFVTLPGTFWTFSAVSGLGVAVLYFILPETEGRTLFEISEHFSGRSQLGYSLDRRKATAEEENELSIKLHREELNN